MRYHLFRRLLFPVFNRVLLRVEGLEHLPTGPFLLASNHVDYLDGFFLAAAIMRKQPRIVTFLTETNNYWWTGGGGIPIDPANKEESLRHALPKLTGDRVLCIFPEGRRNPESVLLRGKTGIARIALWSKLPVVPAGITNHPGSTVRESLKVLWGSPRVVVTFGPPLTFAEESNSSIDKKLLTSITKRVMVAIGQLCHKTYNE